MNPRTLSVALAAAVATVVASPALAARPSFQLPVPCGQTWEASTYDTHWPDQDSLDLGQRNASYANVSEGEPVLASAAGKVHRVFTGDSGSNRIEIDHGDGWFSYYHHVEELPPLVPGQRLALGEQIGRTGNTGTEQMHIHYTQLDGSEAVRSVFNGVPVATHAGDTSSWDTWGTGNAEKITSVNCPGNTFLGWTQGGDRYHLLYKPGNGEVKIVRLARDGRGVTTTWSGQWSLGWTHLFPFTAAGTGQPHAVLYKSSTGQVSFVRLNNGGAGVTTVRTGSWYAGWTTFVPFTRGNDAYFLAYDSLHGYAAIDRINAAGDGSTLLSTGAWETGRTAIVPYVLGSTLYMVLYKGGSGEVEIDEISGSGNAISVREVWAGNWTSGWTDLVPVTHDNGRYLVGFKATSGEVKVFKMRAGGQGVATIATTSWTRGWTAFAPFTASGKGTLLIYKLATGEVKTVRLGTGGAGFQAVWQGSWTRGWT